MFMLLLTSLEARLTRLISIALKCIVMILMMLRMTIKLMAAIINQNKCSKSKSFTLIETILQISGKTFKALFCQLAHLEKLEIAKLSSSFQSSTETLMLHSTTLSILFAHT
jgi:hypothetical protein